MAINASILFPDGDLTNEVVMNWIKFRCKGTIEAYQWKASEHPLAERIPTKAHGGRDYYKDEDGLGNIVHDGDWIINQTEDFGHESYIVMSDDYFRFKYEVME